MDANKLEVLREVYAVYPTCALCEHSDIPVTSDWGTCRQLTYDHAKHTDSTRQLSINRNGGCESFQADPQKVAGLGGFEQLLESSVTLVFR